jgi:fatty acid desaturase
VRSELAGVVDLEALDDERYGEVLSSVDSRLSTAQYSLISMLVAGIYFGLLVGHWLFTLSGWTAALWWLVPVLLVTTYAAYSSYHTIREIHELSEARALLHVLDDGTDASTS